MWRPQIAQLFDELSVHATVQKIQGVRRAFNPFFELLLDRTKPVRPGRIDRSLRRGEHEGAPLCDEDGRWLAKMRGAIAYGETIEEAMAKVEALALQAAAEQVEQGDAGSPT